MPSSADLAAGFFMACSSSSAARSAWVVGVASESSKTFSKPQAAAISKIHYWRICNTPCATY